jgi:type IV pilus assembly protein PilP
MKSSLKRLVLLAFLLPSVLCSWPPVSGAPDSLTLPGKKPERSEKARSSSGGKRDPFRPLALKAKVSPRPQESLSPLERYEIGQLKLVGVVWDVEEPKAMVEDATGLGYIIKVGTPIGANEGKVKSIKPTEVVIEESYTDFYGARKSREISIKLLAE